MFAFGVPLESCELCGFICYLLSWIFFLIWQMFLCKETKELDENFVRLHNMKAKGNWDFKNLCFKPVINRAYCQILIIGDESQIT